MFIVLTADSGVLVLKVQESMKDQDGNEVVPKKRGFAALSPERQREIASMGGKATSLYGTGHKWTTETAKAASLKSRRKDSGTKDANS